ncbi:MAG: hypothetical protein HZB80_11610 [Deltaproteobacteria bacterium]|nr:hypothetical protein [Deltaproteobacteria bacterium]
MKHLLTILLFLAITTLAACSSEKQESSLLEKKLKDRVEAVNKFYNDNGERFAITITSPIKTSLNLQENSAVTDTEMKFDMTGKPSTVPVRVVWRKYQDGETGKLNLSAHKSYLWRL